MDPCFRIKPGWMGHPDKYRNDDLNEVGIYEKAPRHFAPAEAKRRMLKRDDRNRPKGWPLSKILHYLKKTPCDVKPSAPAPTKDSGTSQAGNVAGKEKRQWSLWYGFCRLVHAILGGIDGFLARNTCLSRKQADVDRATKNEANFWTGVAERQVSPGFVLFSFALYYWYYWPPPAATSGTNP